MNNLINIIDTPLKNADDDKLNTRKYVEGLAQVSNADYCCNSGSVGFWKNFLYESAPQYSL